MSSIEPRLNPGDINAVDVKVARVRRSKWLSLCSFRLSSSLGFGLSAAAVAGCNAQVREFGELPTQQEHLLADAGVAGGRLGATQTGSATESSGEPETSPDDDDGSDAPGVIDDAVIDSNETGGVDDSSGGAADTAAAGAAGSSHGEPDAAEEHEDSVSEPAPTGCEGVEPGADEACDAQPPEDDDVCAADCAPPECGNGVLEVGEACDDGNAIDDDECNTDCTVPGCGDGIVQEPREECDDGADGDSCTAACKFPRCGDGFVHDGEECDDGNAVNDDACTQQCRLPQCGDEVVSTGEGCDDGNAFDGDGCSSSCQLEVCGDGIVSGGDACDDGNLIDGDGCSATCKRERCGDGNTTANEQCDDGNLADNDGCSSTCKDEFCGDGIVQPPREQCEDLNTSDTDVCRNGCQHAASLNFLDGTCAYLDQITQTVCMVATAKWCQQYGHDPIAGLVTGVQADDEYTVGCIVGFSRYEVSTSKLDQCPPGRQQSPGCLAQINTACGELGFSRGFYLGYGAASNTYAVACDGGTTTTESVPGCNGIADTSPVPVTCAQALSERCGDGKGGMIQARAQASQVTYTCIDLSLTGTARQF